MVNQQSEITAKKKKKQKKTPYWQHIANIVNSNKNIINHLRPGQVCTSEEDMMLLVCIQSKNSNATDGWKKIAAD